MTTINEAIPDKNDWSVPNPHPCTVPFTHLQDQDEDYHQLVNTVERHTKCSSEYNYDKPKNLDNPVARISAKHSGPGAAATTSDDAGGLHPEIFLCKGAKVMLTSNLWQRMGKYNGSPVEVYDILYATNSRPPDLSIATLVDFPCYTGPAFLESRPHCVPIVPRL